MIASTLKKLKQNLFGGRGNTGFTNPAPSKVQNISLSPVSVLDSDPLQFGTYQFPKDVFENGQLGHYMVFYVNVQDRSKYEYGKTSKQISEMRLAETKAYEQGASVGAGGFVDLKGEYPKKKEYYLTRAMKNKAGNYGISNEDGTIINLADANRNNQSLQGISKTRKTTTRIKDSIALYLPPNVTDTTSATYEDTPTGLLGFGLDTFLRTADAVQLKDFEAAGKLGGEAVKTFLEESFKRMGGALAEALSGSEGAIPLANKVFGRADNPFVEVLFNTMNVRSFTYNFNFAPRNESETLEIQEIIQLFRFHMAPEIQDQNRRYYTLPSEFDIHYMFKTDDGDSYENDFYTRIGTCVLENVATNYTPGGVKSFSDGSPTQITMSLTFKETEVLTKEKINQGY